MFVSFRSKPCYAITKDDEIKRKKGKTSEGSDRERVKTPVIKLCKMKMRKRVFLIVFADGKEQNQVVCV